MCKQSHVKTFRCSGRVGGQEDPPVWRANQVINAHFAIPRAQADHVVDEEGLNDGFAFQLGGISDAWRILFRDQLTLHDQHAALRTQRS